MPGVYTLLRWHGYVAIVLFALLLVQHSYNKRTPQITQIFLPDQWANKSPITNEIKTYGYQLPWSFKKVGVFNVNIPVSFSDFPLSSVKRRNVENTAQRLAEEMASQQGGNGIVLLERSYTLLFGHMLYLGSYQIIRTEQSKS